jgi:hypothetical protein
MGIVVQKTIEAAFKISNFLIAVRPADFYEVDLTVPLRTQWQNVVIVVA